MSCEDVLGVDPDEGLRIDLSSDRVPRTLLHRSGYDTIADLKAAGVRNQNDFEAFCMKVKDEDKKQMLVRLSSDLVGAAACLLAALRLM